VDPSIIDRAVEVLTSSSLEPIVDMVLMRRDGLYEAISAEGWSRFDRDGEVAASQGSDPLANQDLGRFSPLPAELAVRQPDRSENSYPFAAEMVAQVFDHPCAPDLIVLHSSAHNWEDHGGHRGEHGSMGIVQARAPFILAGAGVARQGVVPRGCRLVDIAPTVLALLAGDDGARLQGQDGQALDGLIDRDAPPPAHVVGILWDGTNPNVLYDMAGRGELPNVGRLMDMGTTFQQGAVASLPTVTLANHTSVLTGAHPGHHGVLHNAWYDRAKGEQVITNSPQTWAGARRWLAPGIETLHAAIQRVGGGCLTVSINEPSDAHAGWSTFDVYREGGRFDRPPRAEELPFATERFVRPVKEYAWASRTDHSGVDQFCAIWAGELAGKRFELPTFSWLNFSLTDAAFHEGGPHSEIAYASLRDSDARLGRAFEAIERAGVWDQTAFFLVADHGMEENDPAVTGDWDVVLRDAGITFRDEAYGFMYIG
jgi:phosphonoacetate hydrolase